MSAPNSDQTTKTKIGLLICSLIFIVFIAYELSSISRLQDLSIYWTAAHTWLTGENPYDLARHQEYVTGEVGFINLSHATLKVWSPPYFLVPMIPFAIWDLDIAKLIFISLLLIQVIGWIYRVLELVVRTTATSSRLAMFTKVLAYVAALPFWVWISTFFWGGMGILSGLAPLMMTFVQGFGAIWHWMIFWFLLSLKPHIAFFGALFILCALPKDARIRALKGFGLASALILAVLILYSPQVFSQYFSLDASVVNKYIVYTSTLHGILTDLSLPKSLYYLIAIGFYITLACFLKRPIRLNSLSEILALSILVNHICLFISPYAWAHDYQVAAGWLWATLVLGGSRRYLAWLNLAFLISFNVSILLGSSELLPPLWWLLSMLNLVNIYRSRSFI